MAQLVPLNTFKTVTSNITTIPTVLYNTPSEIATIVLMAQVTNVGSSVANITFIHRSNTNVNTELVNKFDIPTNDAATVLTGKLVLETGSSVVAFAGANSILKITLSLLETSLQ
jgi:dihydrodipicolinate synthase/N-acetylneuraminate lyase